MDPVKETAKLLARALSPSECSPLLEKLGFTEGSLPLDEAAQQALGLDADAKSAHVASGHGALRALVIEAAENATTRDLIQRISCSLSARVPHLLWILITFHPSKLEISISCWRTGLRKPRVVALIANQDRLMESDADTVCALAAAQCSSDILTHVRWIELLGREAITRHFFRALRDVVVTLSASLSLEITPNDRRELSILTVSRLLFLSFLETKGWLGGDFDFLANQFAACMRRGGSYHLRVLHPLFFGTLNTRMSHRSKRAREFGRVPFLNGGLFTRSVLERKYPAAVFPDEVLSEVFSELLTSFRFSPREDAENWSETAVDPEILGKAFEALMASAERKTSGAFYTPQRLVEHVTESAVVAALSPFANHAVLRAFLATGEIPEPGTRATLLSAISSVTVLDPACGSGAFLVHALEKITELRLRLGETGSAAVIRRKAIGTSIFGVDVNPMAVWLCQLRLWLAIVIDSVDPDPMHLTPLPNLDRQIRVGDSLGGGGFHPDDSGSKGKRLAELRGRYMRSVGARKKTLARQLDREERREAIGELSRARERLRYERRDLLMAARSADLFGSRKADPQATERIRNLRKRYRNVTSREARLKAGAALPFAFNVHFADVAARGGFDLIVGNPPWVRIHNIGAGTRAALNREFLCFSRGAWRDGAELAGSGKAFANQVDLASLFLERSVFLLRERGSLALLLPSKLWRSLAGGGVRDLVSRNLEVVALEDMTESRSGFDAAVYPSLLVGTRTVAPPSTDRVLAAAVHRGPSVLQWEMSQDQLHLDRSPGSPWLLMPSQVRASFDKLSAMGASLGASHLGRPMLGVKTGFNSAFILRDGEPVGDIGAEFLRPVVRGETASAWSYSPSGERIVWAHGEDGRPLRQITPELERHLGKWRTTLERRTDARGSGRWWSVFRTEGASRKYWRVVWCDFGKSPRAFVLAAGSDVVPLNTCYVARCAQRENALALMTLLNGPLLNAWLNAIAEPARGGYRRYLGWTVSLMPIPRDWNRAVSVLSPLAENALRGAIPTRHDLLVASLEAYRVKQADVEPLISWAFP